MNKEMQNIICAVTASAISIGLFCGAFYRSTQRARNNEPITAAVICDGDKSTPYTANFARAAEQLQHDGVQMEFYYNTPAENAGELITQLADESVDLIFTNSYEYGETVRRMAEQYPEIQFCAATCDNADASVPNYHTFMGEICQGRYVCGVAAGAKLSEMIENGVITEDQAVIGCVAAFENAEVISGYTAFLLGVRSQCPAAVMRVRYIHTWSNFAAEKKTAEELIAEGCVIITHDTDTIGTAIACENAEMPYPVYHVGYNQDMISTAPTTALTGTCINWEPYMRTAAEAVQAHKPIESLVNGRTFVNDAAGGFTEGWVRMFDLNTATAAPGTEELLEETITKLHQGRIHIFQGDYTGVDPEDPSDVCDLNKEYIENASSSAPTFHYVLNDVITIEE
jgi:basic membrane protein A